MPSLPFMCPACSRDSSSQPSLIKGCIDRGYDSTESVLVKGWHSDLIEKDGIDKGRYHCPKCGWRGYSYTLSPQNEARGITDEPA